MNFTEKIEEVLRDKSKDKITIQSTQRIKYEVQNLDSESPSIVPYFGKCTYWQNFFITIFTFLGCLLSPLFFNLPVYTYLFFWSLSIVGFRSGDC